MPAAAEPDRGIDIAFANMGWKKARDTGNKYKAHLAKWSNTTEDIIHGHNPAVICFFEVGEVLNFLEANHVEAQSKVFVS